MHIKHVMTPNTPSSAESPAAKAKARLQIVERIARLLGEAGTLQKIAAGTSRELAAAHRAHRGPRVCGRSIGRRKLGQPSSLGECSCGHGGSASAAVFSHLDLLLYR